MAWRQANCRRMASRSAGSGGRSPSRRTVRSVMRSTSAIAAGVQTSRTSASAVTRARTTRSERPRRSGRAKIAAAASASSVPGASDPRRSRMPRIGRRSCRVNRGSAARTRSRSQGALRRNPSRSWTLDPSLARGSRIPCFRALRRTYGRQPTRWLCPSMGVNRAGSNGTGSRNAGRNAACRLCASRPAATRPQMASKWMCVSAAPNASRPKSRPTSSNVAASRLLVCESGASTRSSAARSTT